MPPKRPYGHSIDIEDGKVLPSSRTRPMSQQDLRVVKKYLNENLEKGFVRPSSFPAAAPLLARKPRG
ncbi:hypothetical protein F4804DRAFT_308920 [Jackrogersella minutella]|nr:hypothetical protein F4804DRAFT_308920 [Jackrogersella minutella]